MKKIFIFSILLFLPSLSNAQIGIGTSSPAATLDVAAANISGATTNVDGVLIPRVNRSRAQSMVGTPTSTIIYVNEVITGTSAGTTVNVTTVGFYFFNGSTWEKLVTGTSTDWSTLGNSGLIGTTNFIGTVDDVDISFRRNNLAAGKIGTNSTSFGVGALTSGSATNSTAFGKNALTANTTGTDNVAIGNGALSANIAGTFNTAVGTSALTTNNANGNTAIGFTALTTNSGGDNTAVGYQALKSNTSGIQNTAVGVNAMQQKTTGSANTAVGHSALNAVGTYNNATALGYQALLKNTASNVTGLGFQALAENTSGTTNTAVGFQSLAKNTTGSSNTAIGHLSLYNTNGATNNTAVGYNALFSNVTTASWNTAIGSNALRLINSNIAQNNTAVGSGALELGTGGILECVAIGSEAARNSFGNKCTAVDFGALRGDGGGSTGIDNVAIGNQSLRLNTTGQQNVALGNLAGNTITSGANNITIGHNAQVPTATASNQIVIGAGGISTAFVNAPSWSYSSDRRLKSDIQDTALGLNFINKIRPVSYFRKDDVAQKTEFGFIAQELEIAFNEASVDSRGIISKTANGMYAVRYNDLLPITIKAVQEQQQQIDELKKANVELTKINAEILKRLEKLENN